MPKNRDQRKIDNRDKNEFRLPSLTAVKSGVVPGVSNIPVDLYGTYKVDALMSDA